jgi:mono/diheme cytochrome c family protein
MAFAHLSRAAVPIVGLSALLALFGPAVAPATETGPPQLLAPADPTPAATPEPTRPAPPHDVAMAKAYRVLERSCAACHQASSPSRRRPVHRFGNVLDLAALANDGDLVRPGNADASPLYLRFLTGHAGFDLAALAREPGAGFVAPEPIDVAVIREWIEALPRRAACTDRTPVALDEVVDLASRWVSQAGAEASRDIRFVSLAHLHNACTPLADLAGYRQAVQKLMNSLSWSRNPGRVEAVGDGLVLLAFRLADFGWIGEHWETLAAMRPAIPMPTTAPPELGLATGTSFPILPADWLAHAATTPALYVRLLGLPQKLEAIEGLRGFDLADGALAGKARRAALMASAESRAPRIVERHGPEAGAVWLAYDLAADTRAETLASHPLLPYSVEGNGIPDVEETRLIATLPNGFLAFAVYGDDDTLAATGTAPGAPTLPPASAHAHAAPRGCLTCHGEGLALAGDQLRQRIVGRKAELPAATAEKALALYAERGELEQRIADDNFDYRRAQIQAGIDPDLRVRGLEPIVALAGEHERDVTLARFAAELDLEPDQLAEALAAYEGTDDALARRLLQGTLSRAEAESLASALGASSSSKEPVAVADAAARLAMWTDKRAYASGEEVTISATAAQPCYLTIVNVDRANRATVIFPNSFEQANLLEAGQPITVPGPAAPYRLRLSDPGVERFVGICRQHSAVPRGVAHDFERQLFTALGNWPAFLTETLSTPIADRDGDARRHDTRRRGRRGPEPAAEPPPLGTGTELRTAVAVTVE